MKFASLEEVLKQRDQATNLDPTPFYTPPAKPAPPWAQYRRPTENTPTTSAKRKTLSTSLSAKEVSHSSFFTMEKKQTSLELLQAELPPTQEEQVAVNPPLQKRHLGSAEPRIKRARLTRQNLAEFNKMSKKNPDPISDSRSTTVRPTSTITSGFADKARRSGILDSRSSKPPKNLNDIRKRYAKSRVTPSPSQ